MEAILKFNLPEEYEEFLVAQNGQDYKSALEEMDNWLRGKIKYESDNYSEDYLKAIRDAREQLNKFVEF